jgi:hypothetical protein
MSKRGSPLTPHSRYPLPTLASQKDQVLDDWASLNFSMRDIALKYQASANLVNYIVRVARVAGDPRALTGAERLAGIKQREEARIAAIPRHHLADEFGIKRGRVIEITTQSAHINRITLSAGDNTGIGCL